MSIFINETTYYSEADIDAIADTPLEFLRQLNGLCIIDIQGHDVNRTRVVTTLIHGNEPSGFIAVHQWLRKKTKPATNMRIIICNIEAAQLPPEFSHRYLQAGQDLNRYFSMGKSNVAIVERAQQIKQAVLAVKPEAVVDLHNTSGLSPAFGVAIDDSEQALDLISLFTNKVILTGLRVGAIMEQNFSAPTVTIECGGAGQLQSHQLAYAGLTKFANEVSIFDRHANQVDIHRHPCRVELLPNVSVAFGHNHLPTADITLRADAEQLNNQLTPEGEFIGWYEGKEKLPLTAKNEQGVEQFDTMFSIQNGYIFTKQSLQIFMATTDPEIATNDCLFYATLEKN
ncbi:MAG: succinylglutamate desuccinylase/aspartoacylase family protein [Colwellia sp.]|nr:succinylglutamate desuccinylase/aspartoacylase family protein [Colwellia sp.]MCW8864004.1 succinylglutamate desuccinylase/aspartoacylase family protein [Colwellia sp.]MCW9080057.1 succinylglutamate desuccinylase/aspartoacylase family protein [Colwellia sp.]